MSIAVVETLFWVSVAVASCSGATYIALVARERKPRWKRALEALEASGPHVAS